MEITDNEANVFNEMDAAFYSTKPVFNEKRKAALKKNKITQKAAKELINKIRTQLLKPDGAVVSPSFGYIGDNEGGYIKQIFNTGEPPMVVTRPRITTMSTATGDGYDLLLTQKKAAEKKAAPPKKKAPAKKKATPKQEFKPHMMYSPDGEAKKANTFAQHLALEKKGWGHTKPKAKPKAKPKTKTTKAATKPVTKTKAKTPVQSKKQATKPQPASPQPRSEQAPIYAKGLFDPDDAGKPAWEQFFKEKKLENIAPRLTEAQRKKLRKKYGDKIVTSDIEFPLSKKSGDKWVYDCTTTEFGDIQDKTDGWQGDAYGWFTKWARGYCGWMSGATVHPESPRQQLDKAGKVKKETPAQLRGSIGECRDMLWEMRDVLAPSACAYAMNNIIQKEKKNLEAE